MILDIVASDDFDTTKLSSYAFGAFALTDKTGKSVVLKNLAYVNELDGTDYELPVTKSLLLGTALMLVTDSVLMGAVGAVAGLTPKKLYLLQLIFDDGRSLIIKVNEKYRDKFKALV